MGSTSIRRFALVAAMVLLAPIWYRPAALLPAPDSSGVVLVGLAPTGGSPTPAIRRPAVAWWGMAASGTDHGGGFVALGTVALLALLTLAGWAPVAAAGPAQGPLTRRRPVIALRAPPSSFCS